ncbi:MAG: photosystem I assembly protein Ycf4 [Cyanobacteriota bacterium]|nr:photosystem I assembly protein Ycf4 [Cyanobacteriota bacterium]
MALSPDRVPSPQDNVYEQRVLGSRRASNVLAALAVTIGGVGFFLTSLSSRLGQDLLPMLHASELSWVPQGLVMGLYGIAALLLATYLWVVIGIDLGAGTNRFDKTSGVATITRNGLRRTIEVDIPIRDIQAVKLEVREGISPLRRLSLRIQGRRELPLSRVGEPLPLAELELTGATLARFLGVPLEGI